MTTRKLICMLAVLATAACDGGRQPVASAEGGPRLLTTPSLTVTVTSGTPTLTWSASTGATSYEIQRYISDWGGIYTSIPVAVSPRSYTDSETCISSINKGHYVVYTVDALDSVTGQRLSSSSKSFYLCGWPPE
ncbi:hypothetical protein [Longimicrobium terrae]|uniref:Fibronectin type-III domain-containing protein n=1 Tax=Longimicrobium terrae TaxID=1639882 RepID=A0A841GWE6_9BACT|nr:hypothetical protein [Longimicrobium terrae]MBB4635720.1 hypothetical protein [Longimicrobium terrae]MBB6070114.1 hypothetical protein [Longimicrobium terrae]NNC33017.1 hypothetical protein [Longimicrobium terrae]